MNKKWLIAILCTLVVLLTLLGNWLITGAIGAFQILALILIAHGVIWLALPWQIKEPLELFLADPRNFEIDVPEEWSDFVALCGMVVGCFLVFLQDDILS